MSLRDAVGPRRENEATPPPLVHWWREGTTRRQTNNPTVARPTTRLATICCCAARMVTIRRTEERAVLRGGLRWRAATTLVTWLGATQSAASCAARATSIVASAAAYSDDVFESGRASEGSCSAWRRNDAGWTRWAVGVGMTRGGRGGRWEQTDGRAAAHIFAGAEVDGGRGGWILSSVICRGGWILSSVI